jgi:predicted DsbA family dithiol-disulfide isomerase
LVERYDIGVELVHYPLHPETPPGGMALVDLFGGPGAESRIKQSQARLKRIADREGLPISGRTHTYNSRLAQELGVWASQEGKGTAYDDAVYRAYFVDGKDISSFNVLVEIATSVGLDPTKARRVLNNRSFRDSVDRDWQRSRADGIEAVPTFGAGGRKVVGAESFEVLENLILEAGAKRR